MNLLYGTVDMKKMVEEEISQQRVAERLRRFYIPILGLLNAVGVNEPEVIKEIKMILAESKVDRILKENECDRDRVPMMISSEAIPDIMKFIPTFSFFIDELPAKYEMPKKLDPEVILLRKRRPTPIEKCQELIYRRCTSVDRISHNFRRKNMQDKVLAALTTTISPQEEHKTLSDNEMTEDEDLDNRKPPVFNYFPIPPKDYGMTDYQKLELMNPFLTLDISEDEPSILEEKPSLPAVSHPNAGDFMALVALEAMKVLPREWITLHKDGRLTVMVRSLSFRGLLMIKAFTSLPRPPEQVLNVLLHSDLVKPGESIFPCFTVLETRPYFDVVHFQVKDIKGTTPREWVGRRSHVKDFPCEKGFTMLMNNMEADNILVAQDAVKGKVLSGGIVARPIGKKATILSLVFKGELGGLLPNNILHNFVVVTLRQFISDLRKFCDEISEYDSEVPSRAEGELDPEFVQ